MSKSGAPIKNKNAEIWTLEEAEKIFNKALELSKRKTEYIVQQKKVIGYEYHYIGEIATSDEIDSYTDIFKYLKNAQPSTINLYNKLKSKLEANCFSDSKKGIIKEATAIMNLKSNYKWTDRLDATSDNKPINTAPPVWKFVNGKETQEVQEDGDT